MPLRTLLLFLSLQLCCSIDIITPTNPLKHGDVLISKRGKFTLGFFTPGVKTRNYLGIWFTNISVQSVVWVANRDKPINDSTGVLSIGKDGNLIVSSGNAVVCSTSISGSAASFDANTTICQILDSGNLILGSSNGKSIHWQSFDHPTHTFLPGMKLGLDKITGFSRYLTSWISVDDPSSGNYSFRVDTNGSPQFFLYHGSDPIWRAGPWIGSRWSGVPEMTRNYIFNYSFVNNQNEISVTYTVLSDSITSIFLLDGFSGTVKRRTWLQNTKHWIEVWSAPKEVCDQYSECGAYGNCNPNSGNQSLCNCFPGYQPKSPQDWYLRDGSQGCVREENKSMCKNEEGFLKLANVKVPDTSEAMVNMSMTLKECMGACLSNCSCMAYTSADDSRGGCGCIFIYGSLVDTRLYPVGGQDVYIRADAVTLAKYEKSKAPLKKERLEAILIVLVVLVLTIFAILVWCVHKKKKREWEEKRERSVWTKDSEGSDSDSELPFFTRNEISAATDNFSFANKLGEGGFGSVYKGKFLNGQEIAVKKLSRNSRQGLQEFKNEVRLIAKLQHRNLVRMLGCCTQGEEKLLIYELMPNRSLDTIIFNEEKRETLDWRKRFDIILGIARGLLYLHQDSRLKIIHRDMKAGNILLDKDMVPKIADFGMARIFGSDQDRENTTRVVGTYGYMAPEYALEGLISIKSDVFSLGVIILEIITGRKNSGFYHDNPSNNLIGHVWDLWKDGRALELTDPTLNNITEKIVQEVLTGIQVGMLCVQECADDRPTMSEVIFMLSNKMTLPSPTRPAFIHKGTHREDPDPSSTSTGNYSVNEMTVSATMVQGR